MRYYLSIYLVVAGFYLLTASGRIGLADSVAMFNVAQSMIDQRSVSSEPCEFDESAPDAGASIGCVPGVNGRHYAGYGLIPSFVAVLPILGARSVAAVVHVNPVVMSKSAVSVFTLLVAPLVCLVVAAWMLKLGYSRWAAAAGACVLGLASPLWNDSVLGFLSEPYFTLALVTSACLLSIPRRRYACAIAGLAFGAACGTRLNGVILLPAFMLGIASSNWVRKLSWKNLLRDVFQFSAAFSLCALLIGLLNYTRFGSPLHTGYHVAFPSTSALLSNPLLQGLSDLLFSGEIGLLVFAPWVVIAWICFPRFARVHLPEALLCGTSFLIYLLFFAKFSDWHGGWVAGPRFLIPILPFLMIAMAPALEDLVQAAFTKQRPWGVVSVLLLVSVVAGFAVQCLTVIYPVNRYYALWEFYERRPPKPWWFGSIPLASLTFLSRMNLNPTAQPADIGETDVSSARRKQEAAVAFAYSAATEEEYLAHFPNAANMMLPNLMVLKFRLLGLPGSLAIVYLVTALALVLAGSIGLKRALG